MTGDWQVVSGNRDKLGESPLWHPLERKLYWIDFYGPTVHRLDPADGSMTSWPVPGAELIGSLGFASGGRLMLATDRGLLLFEPAHGSVTPFADPNGGREAVGYNDSKVGRDGHYWVGTFDAPESAPRGILYSVEPSGRWAVADSGFIVCNGPAFSPDGGTLYFSDSMGKQILAYDVDAARGRLSKRRLFASIADGLPDGMTVDREGHLWCALYSAGEVRRFRPDGAVSEILALPVANVTSCCLGGDDLCTLYVTSGWTGATSGKDLGGSLFSRRVGVPGLPEPVFSVR
ncbi:MAG: SMP-30/gluconolactonase/LRE family protein [Hyphomicrobiales bacterium]